jgi:hypothetical protein
VGLVPRQTQPGVVSAFGESARTRRPRGPTAGALSVLLKSPQSAPGYEQEWNSFKTVLEAHADKEDRDLISAPPEVTSSDGAVTRLHPAQTAHQRAARRWCVPCSGIGLS